MIKRLALFFLFLPCLSFATAQQPVPTRAEVASTLRNYLLDLHGGASGIRGYAERLETEHGFSKAETADLLLEIAGSESYSMFGRCKAINAFVLVADEARHDELTPFYSVTDESLRTAAQMAMLYNLPAVSQRLAYARDRLDWLSNHPEFQNDAIRYSGYFSGFLEYSNPAEPERREIIDFFRNEAEHSKFPESVRNAEMLLRRHDPAWSTSEVRRVTMEKWKDDPRLPETTRKLWTEPLASLASASADSSGEEEPSPSPAAPSASAGAEAGGAPSEAPRPSEPDTTAAREPRPDSRAGWKTLAFGIACFGLLLVLSWIIRRFRRNSRHD